MEIRHLNITSTNGGFYTATILNVTKANKVLGFLDLQGDKSNLTIPLNAPGFNQVTDLAEGDQLVLQITREGCPPQLSNVWAYYPQNPTSFTAEVALKTRFGLTRFATNNEREIDNSSVLNLSVDVLDLIFYYRKNKILPYQAGENVTVTVVPVFVEFYLDNNQTLLFRKSLTRVDGAIIASAAAGSTAYVYLPNRNLLTGFVNLTVGEKYGLNLTTNSIEIFTSTLQYVGKAISQTNLQFDTGSGGTTTSTTTTQSVPVTAGVTIPSKTFVELYVEDGITKIRPTISAIHGFVISGVQQNALASMWLPNQKFGGFTGLTSGTLYALFNGNAVPYDDQNSAHIPLGIALSDTEIYFSLYLAKLATANSLIPPTTITVSQNLKNINVNWTDNSIRRGGFYQIEIRSKVGSGQWTDWDLKNQVEYFDLSHVWDEQYIPVGTTRVAARVRYLRPDNVPSVYIEAETDYNASTPVVTQTQYEIVPNSGRWYSPLGVIIETQYEFVQGSGRWHSPVEVPPVIVVPNAPDPISITRYNASSVDVFTSDNNAGVDQYEYNFREYGTGTWYTLKQDLSLSTNASNPLLVTFAENTSPSNRRQNVVNNLFLNKRIETRVRTWIGSGVSAVASAWSAPAVEIPIDVNPSVPQKTVRTDKINITSTPAAFGNVTLTDTASDTDGGFTAYYYVNARPYKDGSGNRKKFENELFRPGLLIEVSKIFVDLAYFPNWASLEDTMYIAQMGSGGHPEWINSYAQQEIIT